MRILRSALLLALTSAAVASQAVVTTYTSLAAYQAAVGFAPSTLETFSTDHARFPNQTVAFEGFDLTSRFGGAYDSATPNVENGSLDAFVDVDDPTSLAFIPNAPSFGFGGDFVSANNAQGTRFVLSTGEAFDIGVNTGFFGFTSTVAFTSFELVSRLSNGVGNSGERFRLDNARFASAVPGPAAALPFALMALKRRKRA